MEIFERCILEDSTKVVFYINCVSFTGLKVVYMLKL